MILLMVIKITTNAMRVRERFFLLENFIKRTTTTKTLENVNFGLQRLTIQQEAHAPINPHRFRTI